MNFSKESNLQMQHSLNLCQIDLFQNPVQLKCKKILTCGLHSHATVLNLKSTKMGQCTINDKEFGSKTHEFSQTKPCG